VNTVVNDQGTLTGLNTDGAGAMKALQDAGAPLSGKRVLLLGSGGAARAVAITLAARAGIAELEILGVIEEELKRLAGDVKEKTGVKADWAMMNDDRLKQSVAATDVVIHATPIGMHPKEGETVVPERLWRKGLWVMDIVYNPRETRLLREAAAAGCNVVHGLEMLLNQGVLQFELWTGKTAPVAVMQKALVEGLHR
jgi:shikimate dehydrogenase